MEGRIFTRHPEAGKQGVRISRSKYDTVRGAILEALRRKREVTFGELTEAMQDKLAGRLDGSITWYMTTVKLDLEARGEIARVPGSRPQRMRPVGE
jgi:hypothetical protein